MQPKKVNPQGPYCCPSCPGTFFIDPDNLAVLHSTPTCDDYELLETVEDALMYMRRARGGETN